MKKRTIGAVVLLTITLSALTRGEVKSKIQAPEQHYKAVVKPNTPNIDGTAALLSNTNKANLSQADGE
ncbi:hypothetical protein HQ865_10225 [Mucilaginibacter mali]|uniref:Uncharacterized protein n=1 Tax=Mucilaginibacter mali TaxID=2740462 RepID=A0A7D4UD34_9SPHI|nr:hypothetical protein [Mucilaginibacter mali]QKJ30119.1 hypothetical protein HQ865_10225 [Mucilaginibacter mali]